MVVTVSLFTSNFLSRFTKAILCLLRVQKSFLFFSSNRRLFILSFSNLVLSSSWVHAFFRMTCWEFTFGLTISRLTPLLIPEARSTGFTPFSTISSIPSIPSWPLVASLRKSHSGKDLICRLQLFRDSYQFFFSSHLRHWQLPPLSPDWAVSFAECWLRHRLDLLRSISQSEYSPTTSLLHCPYSHSSALQFFNIFVNVSLNLLHNTSLFIFVQKNSVSMH